MADPVRIAMWSGPRNISTALMRAFGNRRDTAVIDEPFYAAFLAATGIDHPMREESMAAQPKDPRAVVEQMILGPVPAGRPVIWYQKHMTHHMVTGFPRDWIVTMRNAFLIRAPEDVLLSYTQKREDVTLDDIGFREPGRAFRPRGAAPRARAAGDRSARRPRRSRAGRSARYAPRSTSRFRENMLSWPAGKRATRRRLGTGLVRVRRTLHRLLAAAREDRADAALAHLQAINADAARPHYETLLRFKLAADTVR